ncbi:hypothetical protein [Lacticaseibacillus porcinae]|uniref:hypothetical protein n=1 Tax=Lacticaseibacillus porcinae TaxID=1123687 RepID=UPI000F76A5BF|nr:hypothetical protein [Lacticaseibacillus porcinae]
MTVIMLIYAVVLFALAGYLFGHRQHNFLTLKDVPEKLGKTLSNYALLLIVAGIIAVIAAFVPNQWLQIAALILGALAGGLLGARLPKFLNM